MNQQTHEQLSALMDGELERDQMRFLLKRTASEPELPIRWARYHVARQTLRRQEVVVLMPGFADGVMARLEHEPATHARTPATWLRWGTGGAIAASVAVAALMLTRPAIEAGPAPGPAMAARNASPQVASINTAPATVTSPASTNFRPPLLAPNGPIEAAPASFGTDVVEPLSADPRLQSYLIRHYQTPDSAGQSNLVPYVLLAVPQREAAMQQQERQPAQQRR